MLVNPYDVVGVAEAIHSALEMSREERRERMQRMRRQVMEYNIYMWAANILGDLRDLRLEPAEAIAPGRVAPVVSNIGVTIREAGLKSNPP